LSGANLELLAPRLIDEIVAHLGTACLEGDARRALPTGLGSPPSLTLEVEVSGCSRGARDVDPSHFTAVFAVGDQSNPRKRVVAVFDEHITQLLKAVVLVVSGHHDAVDLGEQPQ
jgi:hypothetical protein